MFLAFKCTVPFTLSCSFRRASVSFKSVLGVYAECTLNTMDSNGTDEHCVLRQKMDAKKIPFKAKSKRLYEIEF